jgi:enoyl-CoA hydratase/carnithine racemase
MSDTHTCANDQVRVIWQDGIATIVLDGDSSVNAIDVSLAADFAEAVREVEASTARVALLRGEGDVYCAGGDLTAAPDEFLEAVEVSLDAIVSIFESERPYVAAIHGAAIGGGLEIALACDLRVAGPDATLALPEAGLGIIPPAGSIRLLAQLVGIGRARDVLLTGRELSGETAEEWGLVSRTAPDPVEGGRELAETVASQSSDAVGAILKSITEAYPRPITSATWDLSLVRPLADSDGFRRAKAAFAEGQRHDFSDDGST